MTFSQRIVSFLFLLAGMAAHLLFWLILSHSVWLPSLWTAATAQGARWNVAECLLAFFNFSEMLDTCWGILLLRAVKPKIEPLAVCTDGTPPRVAMLVTKVPSEPWAMVKKTLSAMLAQADAGVDAYHVWLADEDPSDETRAWCAEQGVRISCRKGNPDYHRKKWPRRARCKEGNLAFFYDHWGYAQYDIVAQFDADHVPDPSYLRCTLPAFNDPKVGYVCAPSICDANARESWAARGRLYYEALMHGAWSAARSNGALPCCIGSHYSVRTAALLDIGGIGPELDEDLSTSLYMAACEWKGTCAIDAIAHGDGPVTFEDAMRQEYQWSRSAVLILFQYLGPAWNLPFMNLMERISVFFFFYYYLKRAVQVPLLLFILTFVAFELGDGVRLLPQYTIALTLLPMIPFSLNWAWLRFLGLLRPVNARFLSYEAPLHVLCSPLWISMGVLHGLCGALFGIFFDIKITPKGPGDMRVLGINVLLPLLLVSVYCGLLTLRTLATHSGTFTLALLCMCGSFWVMAVLVGVLHYCENGCFGRSTAFVLFLSAVVLAIAIRNCGEIHCYDVIRYI